MSATTICRGAGPTATCLFAAPAAPSLVVADSQGVTLGELTQLDTQQIGGLLFRSQWTSAVGTGDLAFLDLTNAVPSAWTEYEVGGGLAANPTELVVVNTTAPPGLTTALRVQQQGPRGSSNEPPGFTVVTERAFNATAEAGWGAFAGSGAHQGLQFFTIITDVTAPQSPSNVGQIELETGFGGGTEPAFTEFTGVASFGFTRVYLAFWLKLSSNWQGHDEGSVSGVNKIVLLWMHGNPVIYWSAQGFGSGPLEPQMRLQNINGPDRNLTPNLGGATVSRGVWHRWESLLSANTAGNADGEAHLWLDGVKVTQYTDVAYAALAQSHVWGSGGKVEWRPIWGGSGGTVNATMQQWMDHLYLSGQP